MQRPIKKVSDSYTEHVEVITQASLNGYNRLFGGTLMQWIDIVAAVVARRHSERNVTTAVVDMLQFKAPAHSNDTIVITGKITYVGNSSMEICVQTYVEQLTGIRDLINKAYVVMVALDEHEKPTLVPTIELTTNEEKAEWEQALIRKERRNIY